MCATKKRPVYVSKKEQLGLIGLLLLICLTLLLDWGLRKWLRKAPDIEEQQLRLAWNRLYKQDPDSIALNAPVHLFYFDPNSIDSLECIQLGLSARSTHYLLNWRQKGKVFRQPEELKALYTLSSEQYERLRPFIRILPVHSPERAYTNQEWNPRPGTVHLNTIDSAHLVQLRGIGTYLAHKIILYRKGLGGFLNVEQLKEVYNFSDSTMQYFQTIFVVDKKEIHLLPINTAVESELAAHPYIGSDMAHNIIRLRLELNKYENINQLRQVPLMIDEKYRKIAPYCSIE